VHALALDPWGYARAWTATKRSNDPERILRTERQAVIETGRHLRDDGMARALESEEAWIVRYDRILQAWFVSRPDGFRFTGEMLRMVAREKGIEEPHIHNVWAAAASRILHGWRREEKIRDTGQMISARSPKTRAHRMPQYEKIVTRRYRVAEPENQMELLT
jgi:hypothetical protein